MDYDSFDAVLHWIFRSVGHLPLFSSYTHFFIDSRRRLVQTLRREHRRWRLSKSRARLLQSFPIREPLFGTIRSCRTQSQPPSRRKNSFCRCSLRSRHHVIFHHHHVFIFFFSPFHCSSDDATAIYIDLNTRIQILDSVNHLPKADKEQCGAFIVRLYTSIKLLFELKKY